MHPLNFQPLPEKPFEDTDSKALMDHSCLNVKNKSKFNPKWMGRSDVRLRTLFRDLRLFYKEKELEYINSDSHQPEP